MPKLKNNTDRDIFTDSGHVIPKSGSLLVDDDTLVMLSTHPFIARHLRGKTLTIEVDQVAEVPKLTRAEIAKAGRVALLEIIEAHGGYAAEDLKDVTVDGKDGEDGLRDIAARLVFVDV